MSARKKAASVPTPAAATADRRKELWPYLAIAASMVVLGFTAYAPALHGPFLFDDLSLPFAVPYYSDALRDWLGAIRPLLMATYWVNYRISGADTGSYHLVGLLIHVVASLLVFSLLRRFVEWAGVESSRRDLLAATGAAVFLLHPVQTESVAYIAGRSECLSVMFVMAGYALFVWRRGAITWLRTAAVLVVFAAAALSKEHAVVLVPLMLLTDYWWNPGFSFDGIRRNWKLYLPVIAGALGSLAMVWRLITSATTAGFGMKDLPWYEYLFTQFRALFVYLRIFVVPAGLSIDYDLPFSKTILDHGAIFGLAVLLGISAAAWYYRREYRLASFGWFAFLLLMAPTSSILPIRDPIAERRLYLGMFGLLLIVIEGLARLKLNRGKSVAVLAAVCLIGVVTTRSRAAVWASSLALWQDTVAKAPQKARPRFQLASAWYHEGRCDLAVTEFAETAKLQKPTYDLLVDWGLAYDCLGQFDAALAKFREAAALEPSAHIWSQVGMVFAKQARWAEALEAIERSLKIDPNYVPALVYKGGVYLSTNNPAAASESYRRALAINKSSEQAQKGYAMALEQLRRQK